MENIKNKSVGEIVKLDFRAADVFSSYGIDFCCGGKISVSEACANAKTDESIVIRALENLQNKVGSAVHDFDSWNIGFLADYIQNTHHEYVKKAIPQILPLAQKVADVHGEHHSEVIRINELFQDLAEELLAHLQKEEMILFPYIKKLVADESAGKCTDPGCFGSIGSPISVMEAEHENAGLILKEMYRISDGYSAPEDACNTFRVLYGKLKEFEDDLHRHIHLENNILFPKAIEKEQLVLAS
ncbi:nitric oxide-dependent regulator DnrN or NorA [Aquipluma nitroreducens]|uniref:Nitric oxide-dependent regulator DnrN or NorA n=1 Tax=Aquipluma nitroreducens TaxID=2010828 RepID=A0A5K7S5W2_9BACT|nr:iron-sulfur cluster repair di-iron protein [Aquipluma nitroreducens]BBE16923.1 nitric oxide-dependent regulator DnrN or NorA [Aquipluma nitroreducens]